MIPDRSGSPVPSRTSASRPSHAAPPVLASRYSAHHDQHVRESWRCRGCGSCSPYRRGRSAQHGPAAHPHRQRALGTLPPPLMWRLSRKSLPSTVLLGRMTRCWARGRWAAWRCRRCVPMAGGSSVRHAELRRRHHACGRQRGATQRGSGGRGPIQRRSFLLLCTKPADTPDPAAGNSASGTASA